MEDSSIFGNKFSTYNSKNQKRKNTRVRVEIPCQISIISQKKHIDGILLEIGIGGIKFQSNSLYYEGELITIEFPLNKKPMLLKGVVVRVLGKNVAVKLEPPPEDTAQILQKFIYNYYVGDPKNKTA